MERWRRRLQRGLDLAGMVLFVTMLASTASQVLFRYVLRLPMMWTEELSRLLLVAVTYVGAAAVWCDRAHLRIDYLETRLPPRGAATLRAALHVVSGLFLLTVLVGAVRMIGVVWAIKAASLPWLRMGYVYLAVAAGAAFMLLYAVLDLVQTVLPRRTPGKGPDTA